MRSLLALSALLSATTAHAADLQYWSDGKAELAGYALVQPRYGELRKGSAVLIFVKEDFSESARVKADPGRHPDSDVFPVLKLNVVKDFQTGIYDYNLMTSAFAAFVAHGGRPAGAAVKLSFSAQEWCGVTHDQLLFDARGIRRSRHSYFDGEGDEASELDSPPGGVAVDVLPMVVRGIGAEVLRPGETRSMPMLPSLERTRLLHRKLAWEKGTLSRLLAAKSVVVPAGRFEVETWSATLEGGDEYRFDVERAEPRRLVQWSGPEGERGALLGSDRLKYWEMHGEGAEAALSRLGLRAQSFPPASTN